MNAGRWTRRRVGPVVLSALVAGALLGANPASNAAEETGFRAEPRTPVARQEVAYVRAGEHLYLAGGIEAPGLTVFSRRHERYFPLTRGWERLRDLPTDAHHLSGVAAGGRVYYLGGLRGFPFTVSGEVWSYDPGSDSFTPGARMPDGRERGAAGVTAYQGRIYVAGGQRAESATAEFDVYDPATRQWQRLPDMPVAREHLAAVVVGRRLFVLGGRDDGRIGRTDVFNLATRRWEAPRAPMPTPRAGFAAAVFDGLVYTFGGEDAPGPGGLGSVFDDVEAYDPATDRWQALPPMPQGLHGIQAATASGRIWIAGGATVQGYAPTDQHLGFAPGDHGR